MRPVLHSRIGIKNGSAEISAAVEMAWMNHATWRRCRLGLKPAPQHRDFSPEKEGVS